MSDPFDEVARGLRREVGGELRADAEAAERDAAMSMVRGRDLADVSAWLRDRGSRLEVDVVGRRLRGTAVGAGRDVLVLAMADGTAAVPTSAIVAIAELDTPRSAGGRTVEVRSWRTWLLGLEGRDGTELVTRSGASLGSGVVDAVAVDHVVWRQGTATTWVAVDGLGLVVSRG